MCGITGKIYFNDEVASADEVLVMNKSVKHRGPDDSGIYVSQNKKVGLGQQRLSIIDLSPLGHQPMSYLDRYWITFNGEIYGFQTEKNKLIKMGYKFKSKSDTEVIMALYDRYSVKCLNHLRGMFSFALYDEKKNVLFCARDRVGKKPFKYFINKDVFIFGSELKAILTQKEYKKEIDYVAIHHYLTYQYVPSPMTGFVGIKKLEPAHYLFIDLNTKKFYKKQYWKLDYSKKLDLSETEWKKRIIAKLDESVKLRMISDVPIGAFLSGGIDSSAIVALMAKHSIKPIKTFSIGFNEEKYNELKYARIIAKKFNTDHREFIVKPDAIGLLPSLVRQYEEPYADSSALATYYVCKMTRDFVTVALNGDGGDENFGGYGRYSVQKFGLWYDKIMFLHKLIILPASKLLANNLKTTFFDRAYRFAKTLSDDYTRRYINYICYFTNEMKDKIYTEKFKRKMEGVDSYDIVSSKFKEAGAKDKMDQTLYADFNTYLPDDLMVKVDIDAMSVSLEGRSPFLDHEMLELTAKIPFNLKIKGLNNKKYILKEALRGLIPDEVMFRPKMGFGIPIDVWFRGELKKYAYDLLLSKRAIKRGLFKRVEIKNILDIHSSTKVSYAYQIWALVTLELWFREYFD